MSGEHSSGEVGMDTFTGSSPRERGAHVVSVHQGRGFRIIPA